MTFVGKACTWSAVVVAILAVLLGSLFTVIPERVGLWSYLDHLVDGNGNRLLMGIAPAVHIGAPFGFELADMPDLTGKVMLVTGANSGLGLATASHLAGKGATVVLGCRTIAKGEAAAKEIMAVHPTALLEPLALDLGSFKSIRQAAKDFTAKHNALHSLILNAGIMMTPFGLTEDTIEQQIGVNHFGHFLLTQLLLPVVEASSEPASPATIVVLSSMAHYESYKEGVRLSLAAMNNESAYDTVKAYGQSKLANVLFAQELATRVKNGVLVNAVHPGGVSTNLGHHIMATIMNKLPAAMGKHVVNALQAVLTAMWWTPDVAALSTLHAAVGPALIEAKTTGAYFHPIARQNKPCALHAGNVTLQKALWTLSEELVK
jgi:NAD(P)-dependent dehydrogenase (short-subunit alcohol dehydrogenase family)